jgi:cytochrome c556
VSPISYYPKVSVSDLMKKIIHKSRFMIQCNKDRLPFDVERKVLRIVVIDDLVV